MTELGKSQVTRLTSIATSNRCVTFLSWVGAGMIGLITFLLRAIHLGPSYDIFIDEITYLHIARSIAEHLQVTLYGKAFYLHPPVFFFIEAAYLKIFQVTGSMIDQIYMVRYLNAGFASLSAITIMLMAKRIAGWSAGLIAAVLFALDSFIIKMNSLNLLDTSALWWVLAGYWFLITAMPESGKILIVWHKLTAISPFAAKLFNTDQVVLNVGNSNHGKSVALWRLVIAGLCFGLALLTKDMTVFLTLLPLAICFMLNWVFQRVAAILIATVASLIYAIYPLTILIIGDWEQFKIQKLSGISRLVGVVKITGVNREGGPSLLETIIARLDQFGTTYILIAFGLIGLAILLLFGGSIGRFIATWTASAYALLVYAAIFGTLEEQFFYFLVLSSLLTTATGAVLFFKLDIVRERIRHWLLACVVVLSLCFVSWSSIQWSKTHFTPDNAYQRVLVYLRQNVAPNRKVAATSETAQFLLEEYATGPWGIWFTPAELLAYSPDYVIITPHTLKWDAGIKAVGLVEWMEHHGEPIFIFTGRGDNQIILYHLHIKK